MTLHTFTEFTGIEYLQIDIASNFGHDKLSWQDRIQWTQEHESVLEKLVQKAEEPALFYAGVQAYRKAQKGLPTGYPVSLDATSSGLQILASLVGCERSARTCNVLPTGSREDAYTNIYEAMLKHTDGKAKITRADAKAAIMTSLYGSKAQPKKMFGKGTLLEIFYQTMLEETPGAWKLNKILIDSWQPYAMSHDWVLPDNFHAHIKVMTPTVDFIQFEGKPIEVYLNKNIGSKEGLSVAANLVHSIDGMVVREMHRRCSYDLDMMIEVIEGLMEKKGSWGQSRTRKQDVMLLKIWEHYENSGFLSARIFEFLDQENMGLIDYSVVLKLVKSMPEKPFPIISIHDCFRCHPNYANDLRRQYNQILHEITKSEMLGFLLSQIHGSPVQIVKAGDIADEILRADYALS